MTVLRTIDSFLPGKVNNCAGIYYSPCTESDHRICQLRQCDGALRKRPSRKFIDNPWSPDHMRLSLIVGGRNSRNL